MKKGIIIKGYSSFYYVEHANKIFECSLRGRHRLKSEKFLPGDEVLFTTLDNYKGVIEQVLPRRNQLLRPPIANMDQVVIVSSLKNPGPDLWFIDRLTTLALWSKIDPVICFNKADLDGLLVKDVLSIYAAFFTVVVASAKTGKGIQELRTNLQDKTTVFAGPSGVGKSSLLNALEPRLLLKTGEISAKSKRGRHTTRHVELIPLEFGGLVADTPGFSILSFPREMRKEQLTILFPDFYPTAQHCRFSSCLHRNEPQCAVKQQVESKEINSNRYSNYLAFLEEIESQERSY